MELLLFIQEHLRTAIGDFFFPLVTHLGDAGVVWIALGFSLLIPKKTRRCGSVSYTHLDVYKRQATCTQLSEMGARRRIRSQSVG